MGIYKLCGVGIFERQEGVNLRGGIKSIIRMLRDILDYCQSLSVM